MNIKKFSFACAFVLILCGSLLAQTPFVKVKKHQFFIGKKPYYFVGANYWYGLLLGLEITEKGGIARLRRELDFLKANGVTNLRIMAGAEGSGQIAGIERVAAPLQNEQGNFDEIVARSLDLLLDEIGKRDMKAVIFLSNNWEWSGGFQQYLIWAGQIKGALQTRKLTWDEQRDIVAKFYGCEPCKQAYNRQVDFLLSRTNTYNNRKYLDDPTIMAWELANEPRPMRPSAEKAYKKWIADTAAMIKQKDKNHLVCIGHEGRIGTEGMKLFEEIHTDKNIDYLTIHIWAKNWDWFRKGKLAEDYTKVAAEADKYIREHVVVARKLDKPLVIEEFGLPRDLEAIDTAATTNLRDDYYSMILSRIKSKRGGGKYVAGVNFWSYGGEARPDKNQPFFQKGDDYTGDPPMEEQGLNSVFNTDLSTWKIINEYSERLKGQKRDR